MRAKVYPLSSGCDSVIFEEGSAVEPDSAPRATPTQVSPLPQPPCGGSDIPPLSITSARTRHRDETPLSNRTTVPPVGNRVLHKSMASWQRAARASSRPKTDKNPPSSNLNTFQQVARAAMESRAARPPTTPAVTPPTTNTPLIAFGKQSDTLSRKLSGPNLTDKRMRRLSQRSGSEVNQIKGAQGPIRQKSITSSGKVQRTPSSRHISPTISVPTMSGRISIMIGRRFSTLPDGVHMREMRNNAALGTCATSDSLTKPRNISRFIIHPFSPFRWHWDLMMVILIVYTVVAIPTAVAFFADGMDPVWFGFTVWVDIMYIFDMLLNFRTGVVTVSDAPEVILDASEIARRYVRGSFLIDFISSMPVDHITVLLQGGNPREATVWSTASTLKVLRFARLLSLLRLLKVTRLFRSMRTIQEYLNIGSGLLRIINLILVMLLVAHWNGCIQFFIAQLEGFPDESWVAINDLQDASPGEQYAWSIFKALSHMLCIGYGQQPPVTYSECWITIWSMLIGATFYAMFLALMSSHIASLDASKQAYNSRHTAMNDFMVTKRVPTALRGRVNDYFDEHCARQKMFDEDLILACLSPSLRLEIQQHCRSPVFNTVPLLHGLKPHVAEAIAPLLVQLTVIPGDVIMRQGHRTSCLYLVQYGEFIVTINDERDEGDAAAEPQPMTDFCDRDSSQREVALLSDGDIFGEISFLDPTRCRNATVTATAPGRIFSLVHSHFSAICKDDPDLLRRVQVTALERITHNAVVTHNLT